MKTLLTADWTGLGPECHTTGAGGQSRRQGNGVNDGDGSSGAPPAAEGVERAIDGMTQKYLNFLDLGSGFAVAPSLGPTVVTGLRLFTANDAAERDPGSYLLEGSTSGFGGTWTLISSGALALPEGRNPGGNIPIDPATHYNQTVLFANSAWYTAYRITFPTLKDATAANSMQIAEVQLLGTVIPEPSPLALLGLAGLAWLAPRRRAEHLGSIFIFDNCSLDSRTRQAGAAHEPPYTPKCVM